MLASSSNSWKNKNYNKHKSFQCYFAVSYNIINILLNHLQIYIPPLNEGERNNRAREPGRTTIWSNKTVDRILGRKKISFAISHQM